MVSYACRMSVYVGSVVRPQREMRCFVDVHVYVLATFTCEVAWMALVASSCVSGPVDL
jgi:hypothetical protein